MKKQQTLMWSGAVLGGVGAVSYLLLDKKRRVKVQEQVYKAAQKLPFVNMEEDKELPIEKAGQPDPENIEDTEMVAEGAQTSVQYYNKVEQ